MKYEYDVHEMHAQSDVKGVINEKARQGWELVSTAVSSGVYSMPGSNLLLFFRRQVFEKA